MGADESKSANALDNWCVILQSYASKKKKDLVKNLGEIFDLDPKDADAAISSTPLILLDGLPFAMAGRIKDFFRKTGAVVEITNHDMIKKNCYQIVWSARPSLSFFEKQENPETPAPAAPVPVSAPSPAKTLPLPANPAPAQPPVRPPRKSVFDRFRDADKKKHDTKPVPGSEPAGPVSGVHAAKEFAEQMKKMEEKKPDSDLPLTPAPPSPKPGLAQPVAGPGPKDVKLPDDALIKDSDSRDDRVLQLEQLTRDLESLIGQKENRIKDLERALGVAQATEVESVGRIARLQQQVSELEKGLERGRDEQAGNQSVLDGQHARIAELDRVLAEKIREGDGLKNALQEIQAREADLNQRLDALGRGMEEKERSLSEKAQEAEGLKHAAQEFQAREAGLNQRLEELGRSLGEKERVLSEKNQENENLKHALHELEARESSSAQRAEALAKNLDELSRTLRQHEEALRARDERVAGFEQKIIEMTLQLQEFERVRQEHEQLVAERAVIRQEYDAKLSEQEIRLAKVEEESRRYRSRTERKNAAATRELGEWIRGIESLRQGLQKLIHFIGSDAAIQDPDKTTLRVGGAHRIQRPQENGPQS